MGVRGVVTMRHCRPRPAGELLLRSDVLDYAELQGGTRDIVDEQPVEWTDVIVGFLRQRRRSG
jgi:hypothetical protein